MEESPSTPTITEGAGFGIRATARIIDTLYGQAIAFLAGLLAGVAILVLEQGGLVAPGWEERVSDTSLSLWIAAVVGSVFYHTATESLFGASLGKLICQLRVVTVDGASITFTSGLKRNVAYLWDALFFGLIAYSSMKKSILNQRSGDHWAQTIVAKSRDVPAGTGPGFEIFLLAFAIGTVGSILCVVAGLIINAR